MLHLQFRRSFSFLPAVCVTQYQTFIRFSKKQRNGHFIRNLTPDRRPFLFAPKCHFALRQTQAVFLRKRELVLLHDDNLASCRRATSSAPQETHLTICFTPRAASHTQDVDAFSGLRGLFSGGCFQLSSFWMTGIPPATDANLALKLVHGVDLLPNIVVTALQLQNFEHQKSPELRQSFGFAAKKTAHVA